MSTVSLFNLLANENNISLNEINAEQSIIENISQDNVVLNRQKLFSSLTSIQLSPPFMCNTNEKIQHDIDINHAISLLKKEDQNVNVYVLSLC